MKIALTGLIFGHFSYSNVNTHLIYHLIKKGHTVHVNAMETKTVSIEEQCKKYMPHLSDAAEVMKGIYVENLYSDEYDMAIYFPVGSIFNRRDDKIKAKKHIFYTVWSHANYPEGWAKECNKYDEVWTPSQANADSIKATRLCDKPIVVVPHGYEKTLFYPKPNNNKVFKVGMCNAICDFKGADLAIDAFIDEFIAEDTVELWLQTIERKSPSDKHGMYYPFLLKIMNKYPEKQLKIFYYEKNCNVQEMADFYRSCNLIMSPHRGDGFGMIGLESLACNVPIIISEYHGPLDYIKEDYPFWVGGTMSWTNKKSGRHHFPDGGGAEGTVFRYFEPNISHIKTCLRETYSNWQAGTDIDCKQYLKGLTWEDVVAIIEKQR